MVWVEFHALAALGTYNHFRHEELYLDIESMLIRSDQLPDSFGEVSITFHDTTVVLSTLSMLSNSKLEECGLLRFIPVRSLVIDEASQIDVFEFMVTFSLCIHGPLLTS
jgi:hypothetical protein